nr:uncharacterized protein LOC129380278 [Dermacentor andersoni]
MNALGRVVRKSAAATADVCRCTTRAPKRVRDRRTHEVTCWSDVSRKEKLRECRIRCRRPCGTSVYAANIFGSDYKDAQRHEIYVVLLLGSYQRKIIESRPMLTGDTLFSYLEGHIGMWLGLTLSSGAGLAAGLYRAAADLVRPLLAPRRRA